MIYLADDYVSKYCDVLAYLFGRALQECYSADHIERVIAYSQFACEMEKSNITTIAFSSAEAIYHSLFPYKDNEGYRPNLYGIEGWVGTTFLHLFLDLKITFEALFLIVPLEECLRMYPLYHEMDYRQSLDRAKEKIKHSLLDCIMLSRGIGSAELSRLSDIPLSTIKALRYGNRDIGKLESLKLSRLAQVLNVKMESLLPSIPLVFG